MPRPSLREQILDAGLRVMFRAGFVGASVRDVMGEAAAPQGSFTNHFRSKEAFAGEVLDRYFAHVRGLVRQALDDPNLTPRERLRRYLDLITERLAADNFTRGEELGARFVVTLDGEVVVDLMGGFADRARARPRLT